MDTNGNYIQKQFCSYEIALALKELGFDEPCIARFNSDGNFIILRQTATSDMSLVSTIKNSEDITLFIGDVVTPICAPLWQQVVDWFRETHGIHIDLDFGIGWGYGFIPVGATVEHDWNHFEDNHNWSYPEAREAAILEAIKIVKGEPK